MATKNIIAKKKKLNNIPYFRSKISNIVVLAPFDIRAQTQELGCHKTGTIVPSVTGVTITAAFIR